MQIDIQKVKLDENWTTPSALADEIGVKRATVSSWIRRNQIDYIRIPGAKNRGHMVDRRTVPVLKGPFGREIKSK